MEEKLMAYDVNQLREVTTAAQPIKDKLASGKMDLSQDEIRTMTRAFDSWKQYLDSM